MKKIVLAVLALVVCIGMMTGCATPQLTKPKMKEDAKTVEITGEISAQINGDKLVIIANNNLMDGTYCKISVNDYAGKEIASEEYTQEGGEKTCEFTIGEDWPEVVYGFFISSNGEPKGQEKEVRDVYGDRYENLTGAPVLWNNDGVSVVFQTETIEIK